ncbi:ATP-binding cassette sub-family C member 9-like isoform X2 [Acanthaster planci]|uniref:ATP-binding cassette sub-family C member 9-like isoform X2 n=1 Tax=Acanthaster planci TaxID=133434 RepID=A0A8B7YQW7_ACAPL|nr:ATP-binding cassette sub-family C member 9-like isoform X2 [Acanthaster planci]
MYNANDTDTDPWKWFCSDNASLWQSDEALRTVCLVDAVKFILQTSCFTLLSLTLLVVGCCSCHNGWDTKHRKRYPLHTAQWILMLLVFLLNLLSTAEGLLTDLSFRWNDLPGVAYPTQPHLYVPPLSGLALAFVAMLCYHHMEVWRQWQMAWILLVNWGLALAGEVLHLLSLLKMELASIEVLRFDLSVLFIAAYFGLVSLQVNNIRLKISCSKGNVHKPEEPAPPKTMRFTEEFSSFISEVTFWWLNWVFRLGYKRPLEIDDLGQLPEVHSAGYIHKDFKAAFQKEQERARFKGHKPSLWRVYWSVHGWRMVFALVLKLSGDMCGYVGPVALNGIILWVGRVKDGSQVASEPHFITVSEFFQHGLVLVGITFIVACIRTLLMQTYEYWCAVVGIHFRSAVQTMVFEKSLRISTFVISSGEMTTGQIANHMSTDAVNIFTMMIYICWMVTVPVQVFVTLALLLGQIGYSAVLGMVVFAVFVPLQAVIGKYMAKLEEQTLSFADVRLKLSSEVLQGIKLLKMYGWEDLFGREIKKIRQWEIWTICKMMLCYGVIGSLTEATPLIATLVTFSTFTALMGEVLTPDVAFSSLSFFMLLQDPFFLFPFALFSTINGGISTGRLAAFLAAPEVDMKTLSAVKVKRQMHEVRVGNGNHMPNCDDDDQEDHIEVPLLKTKVKRCKDSSGSLVSSVSQETNSSYGSMLMKSSSLDSLMVLPSHVAIKIENGCFAWDPDRNQPVLHDLNITIPAGKLTMVVGTVGSGKSSLLSAMLEEMTLQNGAIVINGSRNSIAYAGQKAWLLNMSLKENILFGQPFNHKRYRRVISACALQPDIDMLPAGDQTEIGEKGINMSGGQKQRISVARAMYSRRDIVLLDDPLSALDVHVGSHLFQHGIMGNLLKKKKTVILVTHQLQYLAHADKILLMKEGRVAQEGMLEDIMAAEPDLYNGYQKAVKEMTDLESEAETDGESRKQEMMQIRKQISHQESSIRDEEVAETGDERGRLMVKEEMERGSVSWSVYYYYAKAIRLPIALLILLVYPLQAGIIAGNNYWLANWSEAGLSPGNATDSAYYVGVYAAISVAGVCNSFITTMTTVIGLLIAARHLFNLMLSNIIHMPMRFFDTTPIGRIINRFSADTQIIDMKLTMCYDAIFFYLTSILAALIINAYISPIFLATILPFCVFYYLVQKVFVTTSRELQRLDSVTKSPIFAFFSETLGGLSTIRAYRKHQTFFDGIMERVATNNTAYLYLQASMRWLAVRLVSVYLQQLVRYMAETEMQMNAVERVKHYTTLTTESYEGMEPPFHWPTRGAVSIENISVRYGEELDPVLKDVTVHIRAGEKVGICGRTGSGKSSLTLALLRIIDTYRGRILIDDVDIASVPLTTLRRRVAIIPQDPVLFDGTIRMNLDPEHQRTEKELWNALEIAQLKELVMQMEDGLDSQVSEGGENFSLGQRQLFCLARAFLRNTPVLIMDEATASMDVETDRILQQVVASAFANKTVLTIAHRVATILNSDTILTLSQGEVVEHDTPDNLLTNPDSVFASLVNSDQ